MAQANVPIHVTMVTPPTVRLEVSADPEGGVFTSVEIKEGVTPEVTATAERLLKILLEGEGLAV